MGLIHVLLMMNPKDHHHAEKTLKNDNTEVWEAFEASKTDEPKNARPAERREETPALTEVIKSELGAVGKPRGQSARARYKRGLTEAYKHALFWDGMSVTREKQWS